MRYHVQFRHYFKRYFPLATFLLTWPFKFTQKTKTIYCEQSPLQIVRVSDRGSLRRLQLGGNDTPIQACISPKKPLKLMMSCTQQMLGALYLNPQPFKILIIGLGGGVLGKTLKHLLPKSEITTVELDPLVALAAQHYFGFLVSKGQQLIIQDGRQFIQEALANSQEYDLIMLDAYDAHYIPENLLTIEFFHSVKSLLSPTGVLAANTFSSSTLYARESATYTAVFGEFYSLKFNNRIILSKRGGLPTLSEIRRCANTLAPQFKALGINTSWLISLFSTVQDWDPLALPLRDGKSQA